MKLKKIMILSLLVPVFLFSNNLMRSAEIFGTAGVAFLDSGFSTSYNPSLSVFNKNYINIIGNAELLYSNIEEIDLKDYAFGMEYKNKKKWAIGWAGKFLKIQTFQDIKTGLSISYKILPFLSAGLGYQLNMIKSEYENFSDIKHNLLFSTSYKWKFLLTTLGGTLYDVSYTKNWSSFLDMNVSSGPIIVGLHNVYELDNYSASLGVVYSLNSNLRFRSGINFDSISFGVGLNLVRNVMFNYAVNINRALGYSHAIDLKFSM